MLNLSKRFFPDNPGLARLFTAVCVVMGAVAGILLHSMHVRNVSESEISQTVQEVKQYEVSSETSKGTANTDSVNPDVVDMSSQLDDSEMRSDSMVAMPTQRQYEAPDMSGDQTATNVERVPEGPYAGMTYPEARAKWTAEKRDFQNRLIEHTDKELALADLYIESANAEMSNILSLFSHLSAEQQEMLRQIALTVLPREEVDTFFNDLANHATPMTPEELAADAAEILAFREVRDALSQQLEMGFQQLKQELDELNSNKP